MLAVYASAVLQTENWLNLVKINDFTSVKFQIADQYYRITRLASVVN